MYFCDGIVRRWVVFAGQEAGRPERRGEVEAERFEMGGLAWTTNQHGFTLT